MHIAWVLPRNNNFAIGGYAVVYEYANRLQQRGHRVEILHLESNRWERLRRNPRSQLRWEIARRRHPVEWFGVDKGISVKTVARLPRSLRTRPDVVVATAWQTAEAVAELGITDRGGAGATGCYFIQHYETWSGPDAGRVDRTWHLPLRKLVISTWLQRLSETLDAGPTFHVPNGIDGSLFAERVPAADRAPATVGMLWHELAWKGSRFGIEALTIAREQVPELRAEFFSAYPEPPGLPSWVTYHHSIKGPQVAELYNRNAIFMSPSLTEGWPLPPAESMASGCALLATDIPGVADYAWNGTTAALVPAEDSAALAGALLELISDGTRRRTLAAAGRDLIHGQFTLEAATDRLEAALGSG